MRLHLAAAGLVSLAALAACADDSAPAPFEPTLSSVASCDVNAVRRGAGRYFAKGADQESASALVKLLQSKDAGVRSNAAFDMLGLIATVTDGGRQAGTAGEGSALANAAVGCTGQGTAATIDFTGALGTGGAFALRGGATDPTGPVVSRSAPAWGVEPADEESWPTVTGGARTLIYGSPLSSFVSNETVLPGSVGFDWNRLPAGSFAYPVSVGHCFTGPDQTLIQHYESTDVGAVVLPPETPSFCGASARLMGGMSALLLKGPGGRVTTFSPFAAVDAQSVALSFAVQPTSGRTGADIPVEVLVTGSGGTPIEGVNVTVDVAGNNGSFEYTGTKTRTTDSRGIATFDDLQLDKPGGYTLTASAQHWAFAQSSVTSDLFNLKFP